MRKALRAGSIVVLSYLLQATLLPFLKVRGAQLDLISLMLFALGSVLGMYGGICCGLGAALILESVGGNIAGFTTVFCVLAPVFGAYVHKRMLDLSLPGNRGRERMIKRLAPKAAVFLFVAAKEAIYVTYFFLTGVNIEFIHVFRVVFTALETAAFSFVLLPLTQYFFTHKPKSPEEKKKERQQQAFEEELRKQRKERKKKKRTFFDDLMVREEPQEKDADEPDEEAPEDIPEGWRLARGDEDEEIFDEEAFEEGALQKAENQTQEGQEQKPERSAQAAEEVRRNEDEG